MAAIRSSRRSNSASLRRRSSRSASVLARSRAAAVRAAPSVVASTTWLLSSSRMSGSRSISAANRSKSATVSWNTPPNSPSRLRRLRSARNADRRRVESESTASMDVIAAVADARSACACRYSSRAVVPNASITRIVARAPAARMANTPRCRKATALPAIRLASLRPSSSLMMRVRPDVKTPIPPRAPVAAAKERPRLPTAETRRPAALMLSWKARTLYRMPRASTCAKLRPPAVLAVTTSRRARVT